MLVNLRLNVMVDSIYQHLVLVEDEHVRGHCHLERVAEANGRHVQAHLARGVQVNSALAGANRRVLRVEVDEWLDRPRSV